MVKDWDIMMECFKTYRETTDTNHFISKRYVIPSIATFPAHLHGIKLGLFLMRARQAYRNGNLIKTQVDTLMQYHIHWNYKLYKLAFVSLPSLDAYKEHYGNLRVPIGPLFVIPSKRSWPANLWGVKLGIQVIEWRAHKDILSSHVVEALNGRGFIWDVNEYNFRTITIPALKTYRELKKNLLVPFSFRVPATAQWPENTHGCLLGRAVSTLRVHRGIDTAKDAILDSMEFIWDAIRYQFEQVMLPACKIYVQQKGDLNTIFESYKVPKTPGLYPLACHSYCLGKILHAWRVNGARSDLLEEIKKLGFSPDPISFPQQDLTKLLNALEWFQTTFGYKERVKTYGEASTCLPDDHSTLPGLSLGKLFSRANQWDEKVGFSDADRKELKVFASWNSVYQSTIYPLIDLYFKQQGNLNILVAFQVPSCSPWPTWSWQQKLGHQTDKIRQGCMFLSEEEKDVLETMDFKWGPKGRTPKRENKRHKLK